MINLLLGQKYSDDIGSCLNKTSKTIVKRRPRSNALLQKLQKVLIEHLAEEFGGAAVPLPQFESYKEFRKTLECENLLSGDKEDIEMEHQTTVFTVEFEFKL
jgi:hemin uptake protein HemP